MSAAPIAIVGLGILGAATAFALAGRRQRVVAFDRYVPDARGRPMRSEACVDTDTLDAAGEPDGVFALGTSPQNSRIVIGSACSGRGFEFASVFGDGSADLAMGRPRPPLLNPFGVERLFASAAKPSG